MRPLQFEGLKLYDTCMKPLEKENLKFHDGLQSYKLTSAGRSALKGRSAGMS